jgi:hypothetical protein
MATMARNLEAMVGYDTSHGVQYKCQGSVMYKWSNSCQSTNQNVLLPPSGFPEQLCPSQSFGHHHELAFRVCFYLPRIMIYLCFSCYLTFWKLIFVTEKVSWICAAYSCTQTFLELSINTCLLSSWGRLHLTHAQGNFSSLANADWLVWWLCHTGFWVSARPQMNDRSWSVKNVCWNDWEGSERRSGEREARPGVKRVLLLDCR